MLKWICTGSQWRGARGECPQIQTAWSWRAQGMLQLISGKKKKKKLLSSGAESKAWQAFCFDSKPVAPAASNIYERRKLPQLPLLVGLCLFYVAPTSQSFIEKEGQIPHISHVWQVCLVVCAHPRCPGESNVLSQHLNSVDRHHRVEKNEWLNSIRPTTLTVSPPPCLGNQKSKISHRVCEMLNLRWCWSKLSPCSQCQTPSISSSDVAKKIYNTLYLTPPVPNIQMQQWIAFCFTEHFSWFHHFITVRFVLVWEKSVFTLFLSRWSVCAHAAWQYIRKSAFFCPLFAMLHPFCYLEAAEPETGKQLVWRVISHSGGLTANAKKTSQIRFLSMD